MTGNEFCEELWDDDSCCETTDEDDWLLPGGDRGDVGDATPDVSASRPGKRSSAKS